MPDDDIHTDPIPQPGLRLRLRSESQRLSTQHRQLNTFFGYVAQALERGSLQGARTSFLRFRDALEAHLTLEDTVFFPAFRGLQPDLAELLTRLVEEHEHFRMTLEELHELLATGSAEAFARTFDQLADKVAEHERVEEEILAKARS